MFFFALSRVKINGYAALDRGGVPAFGAVFRATARGLPPPVPHGGSAMLLYGLITAVFPDVVDNCHSVGGVGCYAQKL